jgi:chaperone required for assembly of F1-ATPase
MPLTRLVNSAIDRVAAEMDAVRADIVKHAGSDLMLYRAEGPQSLIDAEERLWGPILAASEKALGTRFMLAEGIVHVGQDAATLAAVERALAGYDALQLAAIHSMTTLTGSALIALAFARGELTAEEAWAAAHADEDWQAGRWGRDETAVEERAKRWEEMQAAARVLEATRARG